MVIDDDKSINKMLEFILKSQGYDPILASDGKEALALLQNKDCPLPDIILTDYAMPRMDGCEFTETISRLERFQNIPVVIMTGSEVDEDSMPKTKNYKHFIRKPFDIKKLLEIIKQLTVTLVYAI
ncbi:MAG TPA: response regulator [Peptococcaceae bacterium]|nr:response regulator [Peptococcaceae bacterium]